MTLKLKLRRGKRSSCLRIIGWNTAFIVIGLTLIAGVSEIYFRVKMPFTRGDLPTRFDPEVGFIREPYAEMRHTDNLDFWTISWTNSLGFLDRDPQPDVASMSCHVVVIGDSFVEAKEVAISEKLQVKLEKLAAQTLPRLNVTTSAFGRGDTGQVNQLPYYDKYARFMDPELLVLVFHSNDFWDNSPFLSAMIKGYHPESTPFVTAERKDDGTMRLRPPDPEYLKLRSAIVLPSWLQEVAEVSHFAKWIEAKTNALSFERDPLTLDPWMFEWMKQLKEYPVYETLPPEWWPSNRREAYDLFDEDNLPPFYEENLDYTEFALDEFKKRADRDNAALVILTTHHVGADGDLTFDRLKTMAQARGIPIISQLDYIMHRGGGRVEDANFRHDAHWTTTGHRWAAEALLQYLTQNQRICDRGGRGAAGGRWEG